jgi:hypothetical protein
VRNAATKTGAFGARFAIECVEDGGVLVDLEGGGYFQLNITAAAACAALSETDSEDTAASRLAKRLGISDDKAKVILADVLRGLGGTSKREEPLGPFRYRRGGTGYGLQEGDKTILEVNVSRRMLLIRVPVETLRFPMLEYVRAVTPKLLGLAGITALHASACTLGERSLGFSGQSRAGKTTTMRAFAAAGASPISEDLVVFTKGDVVPTFYRGGEARVHAWAAETAERLLCANEGISFSPLEGIAVGPTQQLHELWFLDGSRRRGDDFNRIRLGPVAGLLALLRNTFLGEEEPEPWRRHLRVVRALAAKLTLFDATAPGGLEALAQAARTYVANSAS